MMTKKSNLSKTPIIRNRLKINAAVNNASVFKATQEEFGSFADNIWGFTGGKGYTNVTGYLRPCLRPNIRRSEKRGMKFVGTVNPFLSSSQGVIYSHEKRDVLSIRRNRNEKTDREMPKEFGVRDNR